MRFPLATLTSRESEPGGGAGVPLQGGGGSTRGAGRDKSRPHSPRSPGRGFSSHALTRPSPRPSRILPALTSALTSGSCQHSWWAVLIRFPGELREVSAQGQKCPFQKTEGIGGLLPTNPEDETVGWHRQLDGHEFE